MNGRGDGIGDDPRKNMTEQVGNPLIYLFNEALNDKIIYKWRLKAGERKKLLAFAWPCLITRGCFTKYVYIPGFLPKSWTFCRQLGFGSLISSQKTTKRTGLVQIHYGFFQFYGVFHARMAPFMAQMAQMSTQDLRKACCDFLGKSDQGTVARNPCLTCDLPGTRCEREGVATDFPALSALGTSSNTRFLQFSSVNSPPWSAGSVHGFILMSFSGLMITIPASR